MTVGFLPLVVVVKMTVEMIAVMVTVEMIAVVMTVEILARRWLRSISLSPHARTARGRGQQKPRPQTQRARQKQDRVAAVIATAPHQPEAAVSTGDA